MILTMIEAIQWQKPAPEVLCKKRCFLEILQNSQENTRARASFLNKVVGHGLQLY